MPTIEELDIVIRGRFDVVERNLARLERQARKNMGVIGDSSDKLERTFERNSTQISSSLKRMAAAFGTYLGASKIIELADGYTKFTNQLKVAGFEGEALAGTQERLYQIAQKYGVQLESIGTLYGRNAASAKELNLTQAEQFKIVEAVSASLKVSGQSAEQASGALLQLSQVLGGTKVQAEEYNSLIDGARPLLQAVAAGSDKWAGSVAKLTRDVKEGNVTVEAFVRALLKGADGAIDKAAKSTLTLGNSFTVLNNALGKYIGQTDESLSATARISEGIIGLSNNLDVVIPALAILSTALGVGFVTNAARAGIAAAGATTAIGVMGVTATAAGRAILGAFGGPVGLAITAITVTLGIAASGLADVNSAANDAQATLNRLKKEAVSTGEGTNIFANAVDIARRNMQDAARQAEILIKKLYGVQGAALLAARALAQAKVTQAESQLQGARESDQRSPFARMTGVAPGATRADQAEERRATARVTAAREELALADAALARARKEQAENEKATKPNAAATTDSKKKGGKTASGPSADEVEQRFNDDLARLHVERLQAELGLATNADDRLKLSGELMEAEYEQRRADIENEKSYSDKRKAALNAELNRLFGRDADGTSRTDGPIAQGLARDFDKQSSEEARAIEEATSNVQRDLLEASLAMTDGREARKNIELKLLDMAIADERRALADLTNDQSISDAKREEARIRLENLDKIRNSRAGVIAKENEGPIDRYLSSIPDTAQEVDDALQDIAVGGLKDLEDGFGRAAAKALGLKGALGNVVAEMIKLVAQQAILAAFGGGSSGGGGSGLGAVIGSVIGSLFGGGRASGGPVAAGRSYLVGEKGPELLHMGAQSGNIVPNHALAARGGGGTTVIQNFNLDARYGLTSTELIEYVNQTAVTAGQAAVKQSRADMKSLARPRM
jgi:tape measure domain-containing protein